MLDVFDLANKTRKQLLDELEAAQSRIQELEATKGGWNRIDAVPPAGETHFARLFREARITNLLFDSNGNLLSANPDALNKLGLLDYENALRKRLFESAAWTPEMRGAPRLGRGSAGSPCAGGRCRRGACGRVGRAQAGRTGPERRDAPRIDDLSARRERLPRAGPRHYDGSAVEGGPARAGDFLPFGFSGDSVSDGGLEAFRRE